MAPSPSLLVCAALAATLMLRTSARANDGFHPFRDFGKGTSAPPGQAPAADPNSVPVPGETPGADAAAAVGRADAHPYHPFRDFAKTPGAELKKGAVLPEGAVVAPMGPVYEEQPREFVPREPLVDAVPWEKKTEAEASADAAENIENVIRTFLAHEGNDDGCWAYREKNGTLCLTLLGVDGERVKKIAKGRYAAVASMKDGRGKARAMLFTVDFTRPEWAVVATKLLSSRR